MNRTQRDQSQHYDRSSFALPLPPILFGGTALAAAFYGLILSGPLDIELLRRYCLSHPVAIASVGLFFIGILGLGLKWFRASRQRRLLSRSSSALLRLVSEGHDLQPAKRVDWLAASWQSEPDGIRAGWLGHRVMQTLQLLQSRGRRHQIESDLQTMAGEAADQQYDSYGLVRIIHWAMPMLGFLGTVLGISLTLGQMDTELLATQQQAAMNQLTSGLYVAFDTTAIALVLTVVSMFIQFAVSRSEVHLLECINRDCQRTLVPFLSVDPYEAQDTLLAPVREMASDLVHCVRELVVEQAAVWSRSIAESQQQWAQWTNKLANEVDIQSSDALSQALAEHLQGLESLQDKGAQQFEGRLQQWQTTLSEQTRALHTQQKEVVQQTATLNRLIENTTDLKKLEVAVSENLMSVQQVLQLDKAAERIETASHCIGEAVALLATSLERAGLLRPTPQKPRPARQPNIDSAAEMILPMRAETDPATEAQGAAASSQVKGKAA